MPEIVGDAALYQNPLDAAARTYATTPPEEGARGGAAMATIEEGRPAAYYSPGAGVPYGLPGLYLQNRLASGRIVRWPLNFQDGERPCIVPLQRRFWAPP